MSLRTDAESPSYRNMVRVRGAHATARRSSVGGTLTGPRSVEQLVEVDGFDVDVPLSEHLAFLRYADRPGVVGAAGRILGDAGINIGGMQVSRATPRAARRSIALTVDSAIPADVLAAIADEIGAASARSVDLDL